MMLRVLAAWIVLGAGVSSYSSQATSPEANSCVASPKRDLLPDVIAPMAGDDPVWFIETTGGVWQGANTPIKSVWVLSRQHAGPLKVFGRLRGTATALRFRRGIDGAMNESLSIKDPLSESMVPGSASPDVMSKFAFVSSYIFFPSPGCWEITSEWGGARRTAVVLVK